MTALPMRTDLFDFGLPAASNALRPRAVHFAESWRTAPSQSSMW